MLKASFHLEILDLGTYDNLAKEDTCPNLFLKKITPN